MRQRLLWLMALLLPLTLSLSAQQAKKAVTGTVKNETGEAVPGATITAQNSSTKSQSSVTSDANGEFTFSNLAAGGYSFIISFVGYETETLAGYTVGEDGLQLSITLKVAAKKS